VVPCLACADTPASSVDLRFPQCISQNLPTWMSIQPYVPKYPCSRVAASPSRITMFIDITDLYCLTTCYRDALLPAISFPTHTHFPIFKTWRLINVILTLRTSLSHAYPTLSRLFCIFFPASSDLHSSTAATSPSRVASSPDSACPFERMMMASQHQ